MKSWGYNLDGRLGLGDLVNCTGAEGDALPAVNLGTGRTVKTLSAQANGACAILDDATLKCWGWNSHGNLGIGDSTLRGATPGSMGDNLPVLDLGTGLTAKALVGQWFGSCALLGDQASLERWGYGGHGGLGQGDPQDRGDQPDEMGDNLPPVSF